MNVKWVTLLVNNQSDGAPDAMGSQVWKQKFGLQSVAVVADPSFSLIPPGTSSFGTPYFVIVDPRTMTVTHTQQGAGGHHQIIEALAHQNATAQ